MFYLQGKPDRDRNIKFASIRLFYLHSNHSNGTVLSISLFYFRCLSNIMEIEQSTTETALFRRT